MAYENLKQTVNDYEKESINIADDTYNQLTAQMDKTLADIDAFLKTGKEDAATRAAFETAEGNLQSEKLKSSVKTDTAKIMGSAGAGVRSGMAKDTLKKANREYDITSKKAKADIGAYKANAALNISSQKLDVYQNSASMKSDASAQAYEQTMNDRQFEYKKEQDAIDNALANQKLDLDKQQFEFQKQKLENEKMAAAIGVATNLIQETTIENPETGEKETIQYYDFDQDGEMSAAERSLYVEDKSQKNYLNALKSIGMATSVDEISQSLYKMQTDLFGSGIDRVTGEIASWDNYSGFNDEYAKQLYMNFGLTDEEATEMMHEAKAMCFLNNYAKGDGSVVFGTRNADGTYANEEFYRNGLKETGISDDRVEEIINNLKTYWDSVYNEIILPAQNQLDPIYVDAQKIIEDLYSQEYWDYGVNIFQNASDRLAEAEKELNKYSPGEEEYYAAQEKYSNAVNQFNWIQNLLVQYNYNYSVLTIGTEYRNGKTDDKIASEYDVQNTQNVINEMKQEYTELMFNLTQYKDLIYTNTTGAQYAIVREYLKESNSDYDDLEKYLLDYVRKWRVNEDSRENNVIANSSADNGNEDLSKVRDAIEKICGPDNLDVSIVGFALYISALDAQRQYDSWTIEGMSDAQKVGVGIGAPIANLFTSLGALPENVVEGISNMFEDPTSMDGYVPYLAKKSNLQLADIKMQKYVESVQQEISEFSPFLGTIYGIGSSILQNVSTFAVSALANFILPGSGAVVGAAIMSASAFNQTYNSAQEMGVPAENAFFAAAAASFAEFAFEKWSLGVLFDPGKITSIGVKSTLGKLGIIGAINASEEMNTEVANILSEAIFLKDKSEYNLVKQELITEKHMSEEDAEKQAFAQTVVRVAVAGAGGLISGVIMGGPSLRMNNSRLSSAGKSIRNQGKINSLIQKGLSFNNGSEANRIATELNNKVSNKGKVSNVEIGNLARAIASETQSASAGLSGVDDGVSTVSKETALSNVSSGKVSVSDINTFMPGNEDARAYFKEQTGIELSNNPKTAFAQIVEYVATKTGKTAEQVASELLSNAETSVDVTQKTIASLKSSGNETNVKVAEAFEFLNSEDGVRMLEMQKNNQQPSNGTDAELYQQMLTAKQVIENNRGALEQSGYEIGTVDFNGIDVPVVVPKGYSDNARAEAIKYVNEQAKTEPQKAEKTNSEKAKATQVQSKDSVKADSQSKSTKTKSDSQADTGNAKIKKRTITKKNGDTTVIREKETTSKNKAFKKAKQVSRVETVGKTSARYDYTEVDTSNIYDSEMMDEINVAKEIAKAAGAKNIVFISGDVYIDGKKVRAQGFHSIGGTIFVNVDKSSLYARTIGHEVYHQIRQTNKAGLKAYEDIVRNIIEKGESSEFDFGQRVLSSRRAKEIIDAYKNNDSTMSKDALFEEVCAEFAGEIMTNPVVARALAAADTRAGNAFLRMTKKILAKIQGKENLSDYYNRLSDVEKALVDGIRSKTTTSKIEEGKTKFSLQREDDGGYVVVIDTDQHLFDNAKESSYGQIAKNYMNQHFKNKVLPLSEYSLAEINRIGINKYIFGKTADYTREIRNAKLRASTELRNLLLASKYDNASRDAKNHPFAEDGFEYFSVDFVLDDVWFNGIIDVGLSDSGIMFYGMTNIKKITPRRRPNRKTVGTSRKQSDRLPDYYPRVMPRDDLSDRSIAQKTKSVNIYSMQNAGKDSIEKAKAATKEVNEAAEPKNLMQIEALEEDYSMYEKMLLDSGYEKTDQAMEFLKEFTNLIKESDKDLFDYKVKDMNKRIFMPVKNNSDPLYKYSIDFSTLCKKRLLLQSVTETIQKDMNKIMTKEEMISARMMLESLRNYGMSIDVACAICYVESARLRALSQTKKFIDGLSKTGYDNPMVQYYFKHDEKLKAIAKNASETARVKMGLDKNMPKKEMTSAQKKKVRVLEREVYNIDMLSKEQRAVVDMASKWTADRFSSASELENLKENYPEIYTALVSTVAAGSKSKATEIDTIFRAGDLDSLPSNFIKEVNKENGLRMDSWSDFQFRHIADYVSFIYEATAKKAKVHLYAKVPALVDLLGDTNAMMNMSLITTKFKSGDSLDSTFDSKEGIDFNEAIRLRNAYPDNAGTIAVSINDEHLSELLSDDRIDYVIPYHASGLSKATRTILGLISHKDYTKYQSEKSIAKNNDNEAPKFSEWYNADKAIGITEKFKKIKDANEFKTEYEKLFGKKPNIEFKKTTIFPAQIAMEYMSEKYKALCAERGFYPKFYDVVIDGVRVSDTAGYWKTLIDRKMINNKTGDIIVQKPVEPNFDIERIHGLMQQELQDQKVRSRDERIAKDLLVGFFKSDFYKLPSTNIQARAQVEVFNEKVKAAMGEGSIYDVPKSLFDNAPTTKFQLEDSKGFEQIRHLYDTVTDEEYSMISEWLKEFDKKHGDQNLYGIVNALEEKTFASIIKVIDNAKLFNKEAMSFFKDNFDVAYINMETYDNATAYLLDYAGEKLNDVSSRIAGIDTEEPSYRALVEQISRDVMETGTGASQSTRDDIFNYIVKKSKKDMANEAKQYEKLSKFFAENKLIANQDTLSVGNTILSMNGTTIDDYYKSLQREFGKEMFPNLSGDKGKVDQIKYYVGMVDDYNISKTILGGKDIDIYNAYVRTVVNDAIDTTEKNMMYAYRIATEPKMAQKDFDAYKLYRQALAEGASGILSLNQKRDDIKSQIKRIEYGSSLSPQAREYLTLVRKNGKKQVSTLNNREAIKEIYSISKKLIDLYDQLGRSDRAITRTLKGRKSAMYTFIKSIIRNPDQYRNLNRAHASLISLENIIDLTMGADAQMFKDIIVAQYSENESARLRALNMYRVPAADAINKYNIDPNSERGIKIGSIIQLLGEGIIVEKDGKYEISKTAPRDMIYYTDKKDGKGFLQSISKEQFNGLKEVERTGVKGKVEKALSGKTKDRIRERMVDLNKYVNSISNEDMIAVREISSAMSGVYEDLYRSLTDTLIRNGYPPIKHRANYFPHYIKDGMSTAETIADFVSSFTAGDLPTGVDGNTRYRKPGKKWFGNLLERTGDSTTVNAFVGFDKYLNGASHVIYHTEDIQLRRAAADMLGNKIEMEKLETLYALDTIFDSNEDRQKAEGIMEEMRKRLHDDPTYNNTIVTALTRNANAIAGKTTDLDRDVGDIIGRNVLQSIEKFNRFVGRGMVGFNLRSALTNIITIPQLTGTVKMTNIAKAIRDVAQYDALRARNETMEFLESNSSFLYNRVYSQHGKKYSKGYIRDTSQNLSDKNGLWQKYNNAAFAFMNLSDSYTAKVVTAAYYNEAIDRGMTGVQAERFASEGARKLMASRVKGEMPQIFNNRVLGIFTMFQLENSNMFRFLTSDIASYAGTGSGRVGRIIRRLAAFFISEALFEYLLEMLTGSNYRVFSFNPITLVADASAGKKNAMDIMKDLAADIPFVGGLVGEGGRYATTSILNSITDIVASSLNKGPGALLSGQGSTADYVDMLTKLISVLPIAGAGQAKKTIQGIADISRGGRFGPYTTTNDDGSKSYDEKLYYAIDQEDPANFRAVLFGRSSVKEANEYWDSGLGPLSVQATEGYKEAVNAGMKNTQVYKVYRDVSVLRSEISEHNKNNPNKKRNANDEVKKLIRALDATNEQKEILWKNLTTLKNYGSVFSD